MKFTLSWLKEHLDTTADLQTILDTLTMVGLEVEKVVDPMKILGDFKIAEITQAQKHTNADTLKVCTVNTGQQELQIVCGAKNARAGIKVVLAEIGTRIPAGNVKIKKSNIRGVESSGMLCAYDELLLSGDAQGIIELESEAPVGESYAQYANLDDPVIEIAITPNRGDCLGVRGIARDLSATGIGTLKPCSLTNTEQGHFPSPITWQLETEHAPAVMGRFFANVKNTQSPHWMKARLEAIGIVPKTALVDITNYICFDLGRPLHIFDADKLGKILTVRSAKEGETFTGLDGKTYTLSEHMTVIANHRHIASLGGIMGAMDCAVTEHTENVFLESAWFDAINITKTGRALGILSDARYRFERTVNPMSNILGIKGATKLILDICGGVVSEITEAGRPRFKQKTLTLHLDTLQKKSGITVPQKTTMRILESLGFDPKVENHNAIKCLVPPHRPDIEGEHCLVEEVLRIYGFSHIPTRSLPKLEGVRGRVLSPTQQAIGCARRALATVGGMFETVTYAFTKDVYAESFSMDRAEIVLLQNPISEDLNAMRSSILPSLLNAYAHNKAHGNGDIALFESGGTYFYNKNVAEVPHIEQMTVIAGVRAGYANERHWTTTQRPVDVFDIKADVITALEAMGVSVRNLRLKAQAPRWYHPGQSGVFCLGKTVVAHFGTIHPNALQTLGIKKSAVGFEVFVDALPPFKSPSRGAFLPSSQQPVYRDFAFEVDENVEAQDIVRAAKNSDKHYVTAVKVFDVFKGEGVTEGKKSVAIVVTIHPQNKTLNDKEIEYISHGIVDAVTKVTDGKLR